MVPRLKIFLDDWRDPSMALGYMIKRIGPKAKIYSEGWVVCRSVQEFKNIVCLVEFNISHVSFDYDLDETETFLYGTDCAYFLKSFFGKEKLPEILIHSTNKKGTEKIKQIFK